VALEVYLMDRMSLVNIPDSLPRNHAAFGVVVPIGRTRIEFMMEWNSDFGYYSMHVVGPDGPLLRAFPIIGEPYFIPNFQNVEGRQDLRIWFMQKNEGVDDTITRETLGVEHSLLVMEGKMTNVRKVRN
jgi:hypothetical protein